MEVLQCDRDAAVKYLNRIEIAKGSGVRVLNALPSTDGEQHWLVQAFAAHRVAATADAWQAGVKAGLEAAAKAMDDLCFFTDVGKLLTMTKQDMSVLTCHEGAKAIRAIDPASALPAPPEVAR